MPIAASSSASPAKIESNKVLKSLRAVDSPTTCSMVRMCATGSPPVATRNSFWRSALKENGATLVRTIQFSGRTRLSSAVAPSVTCVSGMNMSGAGSRSRPLFARVADDADDLTRGLFEFRAEPVADGNARADGVAFGPKVPGHGLADDHHAIGSGLIALVEGPAADQRNSKNLKVLRRNVAPLHVAVIRTVGRRHSFNGERQIDTAGDRQAAGTGNGFDARQSLDAAFRFTHGLRHAGGGRESRAGERHLHGQHIVRIEAGLHGAQRHESADKQRRANQQNQGEGQFGDDQDGARFVLAESAAGSRT